MTLFDLPGVQQALAVAQDMVAAGIPVFAAPPAPGTKVGFRLPSRWEQTRPDPALVEQWQPGWALCMVCGHGLDGIDVDTYAGGDLAVLARELGGALPSVYGMAATPSGGTHLLIASAGVASKNALLPGIDIKAGEAAGGGRGFLFIAPTVRTSKVTQLPGQYTWLAGESGEVDLARLRGSNGRADPPLAALAALVGEKRRPRGPGGDSAGAAAQDQGAATPESFMAQEGRGKGPWNDIPETMREGRSNGTMRLAASLRETTTFSLDEALDYMYQHAWPFIDQGQNGHGFPQSEFEEVIAAVWRQYPGLGDKIAGTVLLGQQIEETVSAASAGAATGAIPPPGSPLDLTDARLVQWVTGTLSGADGQRPYKWAPGLGWMHWSGKRWQPADVADVNEQVRQYFLSLMAQVLQQAQGAQATVDQLFLTKLTGLQSRAKITAAVDLARGHASIRCDAADFDAYPDVLNTPAGVVNLRTGEINAHDPKLMLTKITGGNYRPGFTHPDWDKALTALDGPEREWYQGRVGQAVTGHPPEDGIMPVLQGPGSNGKTLLSTDGLLPGLGDYASAASHKLITSQKAGSSEHSTEMADLQGKRLLIGEELSEGRSIDVTALKRIMDVSQIRARYVHRDNISFTASHSLFCTTNYRPVINETDHGTWRRLALLVFRYTFRKPGEELVKETDREGDPELKIRIRRGWDNQHDAVVTWAVQGAMRWYGRGMTALPPTERIIADTRAWRASADHVMSFWDEFLEKDNVPLPDGDPGYPHLPCIGADHLHDVFNAWQGQNGHALWTKQTFIQRFGEHEETTKNAVSRTKTTRLRGLSWYVGETLSVPARRPVQQMSVWEGVRFRRAADLGVDGVDGPPGNFPMRGLLETFAGSPSTPSTPQVSEFPPPQETGKDSSAGGTLRSPGTAQPEAPSAALDTVVFDLETADAGQLFTYTQRDDTGFVRLAGLLDSGGSRIVSGAELIPVLEAAEVIEGHNILGFDLLALAYHHGADYARLAAKARDTELIARQADPPRSRETHNADSYDLTSVAQRLGVPGKTDDLKRLARQHKGYDLIPLDDPEYRSYLEGDLVSTAAVSAAMAAHYPRDPYLDREHRLAAIAGRMTLNGFLVDQELLAERLAAGQAKKREALQFLHDAWGLPLTRMVLRGRGENKTETEQEIASPLATDAGRDWLDSMWQRYQIPDPPRTGKTGKLSTGADDLAKVAADPRCPADVKSMIELIGIIVGTRTVYQTAADCLCADGRVHPGNSFRQASGRWSVVNPGLTVFGKRGGRHHERDIFLPDPGHVLLSFDLSQVDMRSMAGHSQDSNYMSLFASGRDAHQEIADQVGLDRQSSKAIGHGWNYGLGAKRMIANGLDPDKVRAFVAGMEQRFPRLIAWREQIREMGKAGEILDNGFGRRMRCDPSRAYTVAPALLGQGGARDIMCESILRMPRELDEYLRVMVHDEVLVSCPKDIVRDVIPVVRQAMTWEWRGVPITCDFAFGASWGECSAK